MNEKQNRRARALLVDWIPQFCKVYGRLLREGGFEVATAADEGEVLTALSLEHFDVVFLDVKFQDLVGLLGRQNAGIPIVGLYGPHEQWSTAGADAVLHKREALGEAIKTAKALISERF